MSFRTTKKMKAYVKSNYPTLEKIRKIESLESKNLNSLSYRIFTNSDSYVLHNFIDESNPQKIEKVCKILDFCLKNNLKIHQPIKNYTGKYVDLKNKIYLTKFYEGHHYRGSNQELKSLAKNLGLLHNILEKCAIPFNYPLTSHNHKILTPIEFRNIKKIILKKSNLDSIDQQIIKNFDFLVSFSDKTKNPKIKQEIRNKRQLIHNDIQPRNVLFMKNNVSVIIDFNGMGKGPKIQDIAFAAWRFSANNTRNIRIINNKIRLFIDTYSRYSKIEQSQLKYLDYFFSNKIISGICRILRTKYFFKENLWTIDFDMYFKFLKLLDQKI